MRLGGHRKVIQELKSSWLDIMTPALILNWWLCCISLLN